MEEERAYKAHVMVFPYNGQGHLNPMLQFSKRMASKGLKITVTTLLSVSKTMPGGDGPISFEPIYDDCTQGGASGPGGFKGFTGRFEASGKSCLPELIRKLENSEYPVKCLVYDANIPWALDIAKQFHIPAAAFFTQSCAAIAGYYPMHLDLVGESDSSVTVFSMPGLPEIRIPSLPSLGSDTGRYSPIIMHVLAQFSNIEKADWVLFNSFDKLEEEVVKWMSNLWPVRTIGPTVPSIYLDKRVENDNDYGFHLYKPQHESCLKWLNTKDAGSVVYVSFGSAAVINEEQMAEMAEALTKKSNYLWVVRSTEEDKLPKGFLKETSEKGLVVTWCPQLEVLAHHAVGCFITHCGWNSTMEAISFGVPVVGMPQFLDQTTNAHFVEQVWGVGVVTKVDEKGVASKEEIERCIGEVMGGERGQEIKKNVTRWKELAKEAADEGGSSDVHINEIIARLAAT